ncbi:MAG: helix-turn-helix transcriptional regulator [Dysgonamonadaceae bacterium]|nr:helix-turn-helix transcriptional regulator [Dysgonamonadaceae bacterium]
MKKNLSSNMRLADEVSDVLNVSSDSVYRRIRGEKELTLSELSKLCRHFNVSMDSVINYQSSNILFKYTPLDMSSMDNYYSYMTELSALMENVAKAKEKEIYFMAMDIPAPHFTPFLELTLFKIYTWFRSINKLNITYEKFISQLDIPLLTDIYDKINNAYSQSNYSVLLSKKIEF